MGIHLHRFIAEHREEWTRLQVLLDEAETRGLPQMEPDSVRELVQLHRKASGHLLLLRDGEARADAQDYLESVVGRGYRIVHATRRARPGDLSAALRRWPRHFHAERRYVLAATGVMLAGFLTAALLVNMSPDAFNQLLPADIAGFYSDRPEDYRGERFGAMSDGASLLFSSSLMVHNTRVAINSFALGLTAGVGTVAMLFFNGVVLGAIGANFHGWGLSTQLWALILPHGVPEIFAVLLAGGGGLILADALVRPGRRRRLDALRSRGRDALALSSMAAPLLVYAALVEGFFTPLEAVSDTAKLAFAGLSAVVLTLALRPRS